MTYMIIIIYLVDAENQGVLIIGKEVYKHSIEFVCSDVILLHIIVGYRSRNHICNAVEIIKEWIHLVVRSESAELELTTTEHIVLIKGKYRYNNIVLSRDNLIAITEPAEYLYRLLLQDLHRHVCSEKRRNQYVIKQLAVRLLAIKRCKLLVYLLHYIIIIL